MIVLNIYNRLVWTYGYKFLGGLWFIIHLIKNLPCSLSSCNLLSSGKGVFDLHLSFALLLLCCLSLLCHSINSFTFSLFSPVFLSGSLIQLPSVERGKLSKVRLGSLSLKKEGERQCFLFTKHFLICTRSSGGKLHLLKVRDTHAQKKVFRSVLNVMTGQLGQSDYKANPW